MSVAMDNVSVENEDYYDGEEGTYEEDTFFDDDVENDSMDFNLDEKSDVKLPPGPPSSTYSPEEESILIKLKLGNCSMEEVQTYKELLKKEHWNPSEDLPSGWLFKMFGQDLKLLGRGGELFESMNDAFEFVEKYQSYFSREDIMKIFVFGEDKSLISTHEQKDIEPEELMKAQDIEEEVKQELKEEEDLPEGWTMMKAPNGNKIFSPEGKWFHGKRSALKYLIDFKYPEERIKEFKDCLHSDGWSEDSCLPAGWLYRRRRNEHGVEFIDEKGEFYRSKPKAMKSLMMKGDIDQLKSLQSFSVPSKYYGGKEVNDSWLSGDKTVPKGWMIRSFKGGRNGNIDAFHVLSPEGQHFQSRRSALKSMIEKKYSEDEIDAMRQCLKFDGWLEDEALPNNWFYKPDKSCTNFFLDDLGNFYRYGLQALKKISNENIKAQLKEFMKKLSPLYNRGNSLDDSWIANDQGVPKGWMVRKLGGKIQNCYHVLSPDRHHFPSRRSALKFMIEKKYPLSEIEEMRKCLKHDGWQRSPLLPQHWLFIEREKRKGSKSFLDADGNYFRSYLNVFKHHENTEVRCAVKEFLRSETIVYNGGKKLDDSWKIGDPTVPKGWKMRTFKGSNQLNLVHVLSPDNQHFPSRRRALKFMIEKNFSVDKIQEMRECLKYDGWLQSPYLPKNWFYKTLNKKNTDLFLDEEGNHYKGMLHVLRSAKNQGYEENFKQFNAKKLSVYNNDKPIDDSWSRNDPTVPKGWMIRKVGNGKIKNSYHVLSPDRQHFVSRRNALKFMVDNQYPEDKLEGMRKCLKHDGWLESATLPSNWFYRGKGQSQNFLDAKGNFFRSHLDVLRKYKQEEIKISIHNFLNSKITVYKGGNQKDISWKLDDPTVPKGWMIRKAGGENMKNSFHVLSPDNRHFTGRRKALKYLIENSYSEGEIEEMRECLKFDGWLSDPKLPSKWLYKRLIDHTYYYLDSQGNYFQSKDAALKYLANDGDSETIQKLQDFINNIVPVYNKGKDFDSSWIQNDPRVPKGWMIKERQNGLVKNFHLLSPEQRCFSGYRSALKFLIENNQEDDTIEEMRGCMKFDGWCQDPKLPANWFYKTQKTKSHQYLDSEGHFFISKDSALTYHRGRENSETIHKLQDFINNIAPVYNRGQGIDSSWIRDDPRVPKGWMIKERQNGLVKNFHLLSPEQRCFSGYRLALKFLIEKKQLEIIDKMRECMKHDDWFQVPKIPDGWLYKRSKGQSLSFIDPTGNHFKSREGAIKVLLSEDKKDVATCLLSFCETIGKGSNNLENNEKKSSDISWLKNDPTVPSGWMLKYVQFGPNTVTKLMSPHGQLIQGRKLALKHMIQQNYPADQITEMKACLKVEGWSEHEGLPKDWLYKSSRDGTAFLSSNGVYFSSKEKALTHLQENGKKELMETFEVLKAFDVSTSPSKKSKSENKSLLYDNWMEFDSEPLKGWKYKSDSAGQRRYLSPSGYYLNGKSRVMKFLVENKYSQDALTAMRNTFKSDRRMAGRI